ncbi:hypothetical protein DFR50_10229 [Roseiarcus fermentans]|uniref:DUF1134 domain-containing protein n=1 Tax=Roseiarcus fermentans TaxID=1473586 RepID=A0A366FSE3_9HYPH|nr:hypothetical protein [Roseiarcus fermentans]RBP17538.1 hypothetical protein DFR50_10229 [Roseiarcus fermentans]
MTIFSKAAAARCAALVASLVALGGCAMNPIPTEVPNAQTIAGIEPSGRVVMTEVFAGGAGVGTGALAFRGKTYPFKMVGTVVGPGAVEKLDVAGEVYRLDDIKQFSGPYVQGTGGIGLETSGKGDLWLENKAGVVMHLTGTQTGASLSLGRDEILIEIGKAK